MDELELTSAGGEGLDAETREIMEGVSRQMIAASTALAAAELGHIAAVAVVDPRHPPKGPMIANVVGWIRLEYRDKPGRYSVFFEDSPEKTSRGNRTPVEH